MSDCYPWNSSSARRCQGIQRRNLLLLEIFARDTVRTKSRPIIDSNLAAQAAEMPETKYHNFHEARHRIAAKERKKHKHNARFLAQSHSEVDRDCASSTDFRIDFVPKKSRITMADSFWPIGA